MEEIKFQITKIKQITMTEIQNSKLYGLEKEKNLFRSLDIGI
jgi:hypothetical protein